MWEQIVAVRRRGFKRRGVERVSGMGLVFDKELRTIALRVPMATGKRGLGNHGWIDGGEGWDF
jgi:hypothetical protein